MESTIGVVGANANDITSIVKLERSKIKRCTDWDSFNGTVK
jgi:hypothetical protein